MEVPEARPRWNSPLLLATLKTSTPCPARSAGSSSTPGEQVWRLVCHRAIKFAFAYTFMVSPRSACHISAPAAAAAAAAAAVICRGKGRTAGSGVADACLVYDPEPKLSESMYQKYLVNVTKPWRELTAMTNEFAFRTPRARASCAVRGPQPQTRRTVSLQSQSKRQNL